MLVIGLTGGSGSGKGVVTSLFAKRGLPVIDADAVYHELLLPPSPCLDAICDAFGTEMLTPDGILNRKKLGEAVFGDSEKLERLNRIAHAYVMDEIHRRILRLRRQNVRALVLDAPQLFEAGADRDCNIIVSVLADRRIRAERIMNRDGIDAEAALRRIDAQKSDEFFRTHSDYVIENNDNMESLIPMIDRILGETGVLT